MNFIVGSATTYHNKPTMFSVVTLDPDLMIPLDYEVWAFDLDYANANNKPKWYKKYNYKDYFHLSDLSPKSFMDHSLNQIWKNETAAIEYRNHKWLDGPGVSKYEEGCDIDCRNEFYCETTSNDYDEHQFCKERGLFDLFNGWPLEGF